MTEPRPLSALLLSHSNGGGGAGRATDRLFTALTSFGVDTHMHVDFRHGNDRRVLRNASPLADAARRARITVEEVPAVLARHPEPGLFSPGLTSAISARRINAFDADIVNVHWTGYGYLSIRQLGRVQKPLVWTLHDMWALTGGPGYDDDGPTARWRAGYSAVNRPDDGTRLDVERWVANRKRRHWRRPRHAIAPSSWLARLARESALLGDWTLHVLPNALDTTRFRPLASGEARDRLGLPQDRRIVLATLGGGLDDSRKGFDLLRAALPRVAAGGGAGDIDLAVVGHAQPPTGWTDPLGRTHWLGYLDDEALVAAYGAADVAVVPSRQDNLPQTATEPQACGTPVVAFRTGGLPDAVSHLETGYLADPGESAALAAGIDWVLADQPCLAALGVAARNRAVTHWSSEVVARAHADLFASIVAEHAQGS